MCLNHFLCNVLPGNLNKFSVKTSSFWLMHWDLSNYISLQSRSHPAFSSASRSTWQSLASVSSASLTSQPIPSSHCHGLDSGLHDFSPALLSRCSNGLPGSVSISPSLSPSRTCAGKVAFLIISPRRTCTRAEVNSLLAFREYMELYYSGFACYARLLLGCRLTVQLSWRFFSLFYPSHSWPWESLNIVLFLFLWNAFPSQFNGFLSLFRVSPEMSSSPGSPLLGFLNRIRHFVFPKHLVHCLLWHCGTTLIELFFFLMCLSLVDSELLCLITHFVITCNWYIVDNIFE